MSCNPRRLICFVMPVLAVLIIGSVIVLPAASPEAGAAIADSLRSVFGTQPVAALESLVFQVQDVFYQMRYRITGDHGQLAWTSSTKPTLILSYNLPAHADSGKLALSLPITATSTQAAITPTLVATRAISTPSAMETHVALSTTQVVSELNVVEALPLVGDGWQSFGPTSSTGLPLMARSAIKPDRSRPFANAAIIRIDLHQASLHLVPGTVEPSFANGIQAFSRPGVIPNGDALAGVLFAAFNGGFKAVHGSYGMMVDGKLIRPPIVGIATIGFYRDGGIRMGTWGQEISQTQDLIAFRQNCPLLVERGLVRSDINVGDVLSWGYTGNGPAATWRSALGLSQDGRFLIYVVGNSLTAQSLGDALQQGGAYYGMQLDINSYYTRFATYEPADAMNMAGSLKSVMLLQTMSGNATQFLVPYSRDFFYLTALGPPFRITPGHNPIAGSKRD